MCRVTTRQGKVISAQIWDNIVKRGLARVTLAPSLSQGRFDLISGVNNYTQSLDKPSVADMLATDLLQTWDIVLYRTT